MIKSFKCKEAEQVWQGTVSRKLPPDIQQTARRKLRMLHNARIIADLLIPSGNRLEELKGRERDSTVSGSTISGGSALSGMAATHMMSRSSITTENLVEKRATLQDERK
jgi:plasmid maintenance system killer protein